MAISTLSKMTVPLASGDSASNQGLLMPKLQYRFRVSLENFGVSNLFFIIFPLYYLCLIKLPQV